MCEVCKKPTQTLDQSPCNALGCTIKSICPSHLRLRTSVDGKQYCPDHYLSHTFMCECGSRITNGIECPFIDEPANINCVMCVNHNYYDELFTPNNCCPECCLWFCDEHSEWKMSLGVCAGCFDKTREDSMKK